MTYLKSSRAFICVQAFFKNFKKRLNIFYKKDVEVCALIILIIIIMKQGKIIRLKDQGFGFIAREDGEKDIFFHANELIDVKFNELKEGDQVQFEESKGPKGLSAIKVSRV